METPRLQRAHRFRLDLGHEAEAAVLVFCEARRKTWNAALAHLLELRDGDRPADWLRAEALRDPDAPEAEAYLRTPWRYAGKIDLVCWLGAYKSQLDFAAGVPVRVLEFAAEDLSAAASAFAKSAGKPGRRVGYPRFISRNAPAATFTIKGAISASAGRRHSAISLPGLPTLRASGSVRRLLAEMRAYDGDIREATVSRDRQGRWWCSVVILRDARGVLSDEQVLAGKRVGADAGTAEMTVSDGTVFRHPRPLRVRQPRMRKLARSVGRSERAREAATLVTRIARHTDEVAAWSGAGREGEMPAFPAVDRRRLPPKSRRHCRKQAKLSRAHERVRNIRQDAARQAAARLVPDCAVVGLESLAVDNMLKNHCLAKSISDAGWSGAERAIVTRAEDYGSVVFRAGRFFPSSQMCSACGLVNPAVKDLSVREWTCPACGARHLRDDNAAINLVPSDAQIAALLAEREAAREAGRKRALRRAESAKAAGASVKARSDRRKARIADRASAADAAAAARLEMTAPVFAGPPPAMPIPTPARLAGRDKQPLRRPEVPATINRARRTGQTAGLPAAQSGTRASPARTAHRLVAGGRDTSSGSAPP